MRVAALSGGVGGARFLRGLRAVLSPEDSLTVVGNTGDDIWLFGLRVCPDLDTVMYTLGGGIDGQRGWGRAAETWRVQEELHRYGAQPRWFRLGDQDLATHILRTQRLRAGRPLSTVTEELCRRWLGGLPTVRLLPMTDQPVETHVVIADDNCADGRRTVHFQEYWVRLRAAPQVYDVRAVGAEAAQPGPGVVEALEAADVVVLPPSNPIVSIGPILAVTQVASALHSARAPVVGVSPIVAGKAVRGMAEQLMAGLGLERSAAAVALRYGSRRAGGVLDGWLVHTSDHDQVPPLHRAGIVARAVPLLMTDQRAAERLGRDVLDLAEDVR